MVVPIVIGGYGSGACLPEKFENYKPGNCIHVPAISNKNFVQSINHAFL
jgi:hypothetical protein